MAKELTSHNILRFRPNFQRVAINFESETTFLPAVLLQASQPQTSIKSTPTDLGSIIRVTHAAGRNL